VFPFDGKRSRQSLPTGKEPKTAASSVRRVSSQNSVSPPTSTPNPSAELVDPSPHKVDVRAERVPFKAHHGENLDPNG
jgi:hypothetical protein